MQISQGKILGWEGMNSISLAVMVKGLYRNLQKLAVVLPSLARVGEGSIENILSFDHWFHCFLLARHRESEKFVIYGMTGMTAP